MTVPGCCVQTIACQLLMPTHEPASNRLHTGFMQQAPHACVVVDECISKLNQPTQAHEGMKMRNIQALQEFVRDGVLTANYTWQHVRLPVSGSVLVLSHGPAMFSESCLISVRVNGRGCGAEDSCASGALDERSWPLQGIRCYLACAWDLWSQLSTSGSKKWVQERLVSDGKRIAASLNCSGRPGDTKRAYETTLVLLQCLAISHGCSEETQVHWESLERLVVGCQGQEIPPLPAHPPSNAESRDAPTVSNAQALSVSDAGMIGAEGGSWTLDDLATQRSPTASVPDVPATSSSLTAGENMIAFLRQNGQL
jgi:hypothetical protein